MRLPQTGRPSCNKTMSAPPIQHGAHHYAYPQAAQLVPDEVIEHETQSLQLGQGLPKYGAQATRSYQRRAAVPLSHFRR
jgi:hypothetical protein